MSIVKVITSKSPLKNIFNYVFNREKTDDKLISGKDCMVQSAENEFTLVKQRFHKQDGRSYYHIIQSFDPNDELTPEKANAIGLEFAGMFEGFQAVVVTHVNRKHLHNHIVLNSVSFVNGEKYHMSRDDLLAIKAYSNKLCRKYGLSVTEEKSTYGGMPAWKKKLRAILEYGMEQCCSREEFIEWLRHHGINVNWDDKYKYITFSYSDGGSNYKCRDNKLFDERLLKKNLEAYFALGGCNSMLADDYLRYKTPPHDKRMSCTITNGLINLLADALCVVRNDPGFSPRMLTERDWKQIEMLEEILGHKVSPQAYASYSTREEYEMESGMGGMHW